MTLDFFFHLVVVAVRGVSKPVSGFGVGKHTHDIMKMRGLVNEIQTIHFFLFISSIQS